MGMAQESLGIPWEMKDLGRWQTKLLFQNQLVFQVVVSHPQLHVQEEEEEEVVVVVVVVGRHLEQDLNIAFESLNVYVTASNLTLGPLRRVWPHVGHHGWREHHRWEESCSHSNQY